MARRRTRAVEVACRRCKAVHDVSDMRPNTLFKCESCGAMNRAPRKKGLAIPVLAAAGGAVLVLVFVIVLMNRGGGEQGKQKGLRTEPDKTARADLPPEPKPRPQPKPKPRPEPVDPRLDELLKTARAKGATAEDAYQVAEFYRRKSPSRYKSQIEEWAGIAIARNPNHKWAHELLDHVEFLGEYISEKEKERRLEDPWYKKAWDIRERKFLQDQQLRDLGLVYKASMPFVIAKERNKQKPLRDERELDELGTILTGTYIRFRSLFAERFKLLPFDGSQGEPRAIPVFWFDSEKTFHRAWNEVGGLRRSVSPNAAAFYASGKEENYLEMMIFGYRDRRHQDRTFDNGKIAHEATHALEDYYQKPLSLLETRESSGSWWFSEGLAEFNGTVNVKAVEDPKNPGKTRFQVTFRDRLESRIPSARHVRGRGIFRSRAIFDEKNIGMAGFGRREETDPRDFPFTLRELIDIRHGGDLDARAAVMFPTQKLEGRQKLMAQSMQGLTGTLAYFQAWSLLTFLYESGDDYREALMRCFDARRNNKSHEVVTGVTFKGMDLDTVETAWMAWIDKVLKAE